jgi:hypothetical protein
LPAFDGFGKPLECNYNGIGHWVTDGSSTNVTLTLDIDKPLPAEKGNLRSCDEESLSLFAVLGHAKPYRIWYWIGDPDEWHGLSYRPLQVEKPGRR